MYGTRGCALLVAVRLKSTDGCTVSASEVPFPQIMIGLILFFANCEILHYLITRQLVLKSM